MVAVRCYHNEEIEGKKKKRLFYILSFNLFREKCWFVTFLQVMQKNECSFGKKIYRKARTSYLKRLWWEKMTRHCTYEWKYKTHHLFHNFNSLAKAKVSRPLVRQMLSFYSFPSLYLHEDSDQEQTTIKYRDTAKNNMKNSVTNEKS